MQGKQDINAKQAKDWNSVGKDIDGVQLRGSGKDEFLTAVKDVFCRQVKALRSNAKDDRYRSIVDMLMLRVNSDIEATALEMSEQLPFTSEIKYGIQDELQKWFSDRYGLTYAEYAKGVLSLIREFLAKNSGSGTSEQKTSDSESESKFESKSSATVGTQST